MRKPAHVAVVALRQVDASTIIYICSSVFPKSMMKPLFNVRCLLALTILLAAGAASAQSAGSITFGTSPPATSIPTLSEWGLLVLAGVVGLVAARSLRRGGAGRVASALLLPVAALALVAGGLGVARHAYGSVGVDASDLTVGQAYDLPANVDVPVANTGGQDLYIVAIQAQSGYVVGPPFASPQCQLGMRIPANTGFSPPACYVRFCSTGGCPS